ncbi:MAG: divalent-cation tolerance protein CutA, partial [Nitrososphaerales archaeon]
YMVISTYPNESNAIDSARRALENKTAVCVNITSVRSFYWWKEKMEDSKECLAIFKSTSVTGKMLKEAISKSHPYEVPEIVEIKMNRVSNSYLRWMLESTSD